MAAEQKGSESACGRLIVFLETGCETVILEERKADEEPLQVPGVSGSVTFRMLLPRNQKNKGEPLKLELIQRLGTKREAPAEAALAALNKQLREMEIALENSKQELDQAASSPGNDEELSRLGAMVIEQRRIQTQINAVLASRSLDYSEEQTTQCFQLTAGVAQQVGEYPIMWVPVAAPAETKVLRKETRAAIQWSGSIAEFTEGPPQDDDGGGVGGGGGRGVIVKSNPAYWRGLCQLFGSRAAPKKNLRLQLLYQGSVHGFTAQAFHQVVDLKGATITVVRSTNGYVFGGYHGDSWGTHPGTSHPSADCWLFTFGQGTEPRKFVLTNNQGNGYRAYSQADYGPTWGGGHDLHIAGNMQSNSNYSNMPYSFQAEDGQAVNNNTLAGARQFTVAEIEVYKVQ